MKNLTFTPRGVGGGGSYFSPVLDPVNENRMFVSSDMSPLLRSLNGGESWRVVDSHDVTGGRASRVQFTNSSNRMFVLDKTVRKGHNICVPGTTCGASYSPARSDDGGESWAPVADPTRGSATSLHASPFQGGTLLLSSATTLHLSVDAGQSWSAVYTCANQTEGLFIGGVHFPPIDQPETLAYVGPTTGCSS